MPNTRIKDLPNTLSEMGSTDAIPVEDLTNNETKKITKAGILESIRSNFQKRNISLFVDNQGTVFKLQWNPSTGVLTTTNYLMLSGYGTANYYQVAPFSITLNANEFLILTGTNDNNFTPLDENSGYGTVYVMKVAYNYNFAQKGLITLGCRIRDSFIPFYPALLQAMEGSVSDFNLTEKSVTEGKYADASIPTRAYKARSVDNAAIKNEPLDGFMRRNLFLMVDNQDTPFVLTFNKSTGELSWNNWIYVLLASGTYGQIAPGSITLAANEFATLSTTTPSFTAIDEDGNSPTLYIVKLTCGAALQTAKGKIILGGRVRDAFMCREPVLSQYLRDSVNSDILASNSVLKTKIPNLEIPKEKLDSIALTLLNKADKIRTSNYGLRQVTNPGKIYGFMSIGQSNSIGACDESEATALLAGDGPLPRYNNLKCNKTGTGPNVYTVSALTQRVESISGDIRGLSPLIYMADTATALIKDRLGVSDHVSINISAGTGGQPYSVLKKGGTGPNYALSLEAITASKNHAVGLGKDFVFKALFCIHGESDAQIPNTNYDDNLIEWVNDYNADILSITGQSDMVKMLVSQISWGPSFPGKDSNMLIKNLQIQASKNCSKIILACPTYMLDITAGDKVSGDWAHFNAEGLRRLGEYFAKVYELEINQGVDWMPLSPCSIIRTNNVIKIKFFVPVTPLNWDTSVVCINNNKGFEFTDAGDGTVAISSVEITGDDEVAITLNKTPSSSTKTLFYAYTERFTQGGIDYFRGRGQLRDSDSTKSIWSNNLNNYCVAFFTVIN